VEKKAAGMLRHLTNVAAICRLCLVFSLIAIINIPHEFGSRNLAWLYVKHTHAHTHIQAPYEISVL